MGSPSLRPWFVLFPFRPIRRHAQRFAGRRPHRPQELLRRRPAAHRTGRQAGREPRRQARPRGRPAIADRRTQHRRPRQQLRPERRAGRTARQRLAGRVRRADRDRLRARRRACRRSPPPSRNRPAPPAPPRSACRRRRAAAAPTSSRRRAPSARRPAGCSPARCPSTRSGVAPRLGHGELDRLLVHRRVRLVVEPLRQADRSRPPPGSRRPAASRPSGRAGAAAPGAATPAAGDRRPRRGAGSRGRAARATGPTAAGACWPGGRRRPAPAAGCHDRKASDGLQRPCGRWRAGRQELHHAVAVAVAEEAGPRLAARVAGRLEPQRLLERLVVEVAAQRPAAVHRHAPRSTTAPSPPRAPCAGRAAPLPARR